MFSFLAIATLLLSAVSAVEHECNGARNHRLHARGEAELALGEWTAFNFENAGTFVNQNYKFRLDEPAVLRVTDYFCNGDMFEIFDKGASVANTSLVGNDLTCSHNTTNPHHAYKSEHFSSALVKLAEGDHDITIRVTQSPFGAGAAAIRLDGKKTIIEIDSSDSELDIILEESLSSLFDNSSSSSSSSSSSDSTVESGSSGSSSGSTSSSDSSSSSSSSSSVSLSGLCRFTTNNNMYITKTNYVHADAKTACKLLGLKLAAVDVFNFNEVTKGMFNCGHANQEAWIGSYGGDNYNHACMTLHTGTAAPGGAVTVGTCSAKLPVICFQ